MAASVTDATLLEGLRAEDEQAFTEIYQRYCYQLFLVAYQKLKSREVAEELVQDLFETLWNKRTTATIQQLDSYLFSAIRYRVINYIKLQRVKAGYEFYCKVCQSETDTDTENSLNLNDLTTALTTSLQQLPAKSQEVFRLSRLEHYSVPEISVRLNISRKTVEYHLTQSLKLLKGYLRDFLTIIGPFILFY